MTATAPPCFYLPITTRLPPFHLLLLFYDCDPLMTLPLPLFLSSSLPETLMCLPIPSVLILICASFLLVNQLGVFPPSRSKETVCQRSTCVLPKNPFKEHVHDFIVALQGYKM